jgi:hypothetical protein
MIKNDEIGSFQATGGARPLSGGRGRVCGLRGRSASGAACSATSTGAASEATPNVSRANSSGTGGIREASASREVPRVSWQSHPVSWVESCTTPGVASEAQQRHCFLPPIGQVADLEVRGGVTQARASTGAKRLPSSASAVSQRVRVRRPISFLEIYPIWVYSAR